MPNTGPPYLAEITDAPDGPGCWPFAVNEDAREMDGD